MAPRADFPSACPFEPQFSAEGGVRFARGLAADLSCATVMLWLNSPLILAMATPSSAHILSKLAASAVNLIEQPIRRRHIVPGDKRPDFDKVFFGPYRAREMCHGKGAFILRWVSSGGGLRP